KLILSCGRRIHSHLLFPRFTLHVLRSSFAGPLTRPCPLASPPIQPVSSLPPSLSSGHLLRRCLGTSLLLTSSLCLLLRHLSFSCIVTFSNPPVLEPFSFASSTSPPNARPTKNLFLTNHSIMSTMAYKNGAINRGTTEGV